MLSPFVAACYRQAVPHTPVWFMRQAGRYMPAYRRLREKNSILELCKNPALAAEVTLQPIDALGVDAAIIFADLLLPLEPMGLQIEFTAGNGPVVHNPVRSTADVEKLETHHAGDLAYVGEAIAKVKKALHGRVPLIGFVGAPFTLASYMIEGGASRHFLLTKRLMYEAPETWHRLMHKIVDVLAPYAATQVVGGAEVIQVFDSWVGALSPADYEQHVMPFSRMLIRQIQTTGVPVIHFGTGAGGFLKLFNEAGAEVLGLDWRVRLDDAWSAVNHEVGVQGNLDPAALFAPLPELKSRVADILRRSGTRNGYIFNLGHGILPETPLENVKAVVDMVHAYERLPAVETPLLKR
jgi:uroporphyrinogen decarboxylase